MVKFVAKYLKNKNPADTLGTTPLHIAARNGYIDVVTYIARHLKDKNPAEDDFFGEIPLHGACKYGHLEIVKYLGKSNFYFKIHH